MNSNSVTASPQFNDGTRATPDYIKERQANTAYKSNDRKRWEFITGWACPFREGYSYVIQRQQGDFGTPNEDGHDQYGWRPAPNPAPTRLVLMRMNDKGQAMNIHSDAIKEEK